MFSRSLQRSESAAVIAFVGLFTYFAVSLGSIWRSDQPGLLRDISWLAIVAAGQAIVIVAGELDLSVGSVYAFVGMIFVKLLIADVPPLIAMVLAVVLAAAIGFVTGWLTWRFRLPSLLVTLGFMFVYRGLVEFVTDGKTLVIPSEVQQSTVIAFLSGETLGLRNSVYLCVALLVFLSFMMAKTQYGSHVYAVGGDVTAAAATGVPCGAVKIRTFMISAMLAGFTGIITAASLNSVSTTTGSALEFEAIAATVIGGVALRGGAGTVWGSAIGVGTLLALKHGMILDGVNIFSYQILLGVVLVLLVALRGLLPSRLVRT